MGIARTRKLLQAIIKKSDAHIAGRYRAMDLSKKKSDWSAKPKDIYKNKKTRKMEKRSDAAGLRLAKQEVMARKIHRGSRVTPKSVDGYEELVKDGYAIKRSVEKARKKERVRKYKARQKIKKGLHVIEGGKDFWDL